MVAYYINNINISIDIILKTIKEYTKINKNPLNKNNYNINFNYFFNIND